MKAFKQSPISNNILFVDFINDWLEIVKQTIEPSTYTSYNQIISGRMTKYFTENSIKLIDIEPINIQNYYNVLFAEGLSSNTVIHHHALIRKSLDYAYKMNLIPNNPADKVQRPKKEQYIGSFYNGNELNELFEKSKDDPLELIILMTNKGLRHIRFHDLRHSCASLLLAKGIPMKAIQEWLGHSNFSTTANIYAHLDSQSKDLSVQALSNAINIKKENEEMQSSNS